MTPQAASRQRFPRCLSWRGGADMRVQAIKTRRVRASETTLVVSSTTTCPL